MECTESVLNVEQSSNMGRSEEKPCLFNLVSISGTIRPNFGYSIHYYPEPNPITSTTKKALTSQPNLKLGSESILLDIIRKYLAIHNVGYKLT